MSFKEFFQFRQKPTYDADDERLAQEKEEEKGTSYKNINEEKSKEKEEEQQEMKPIEELQKKATEESPKNAEPSLDTKVQKKIEQGVETSQEDAPTE